MKRTIVSVAAGLGSLFLGLGIASGTQAQTAQPTPQAAPAEVIPMEQILAQLKADGYGEIYEVERESGRYEVKAKNQEGRRVELYLDARTGELLKVEDDD